MILVLITPVFIFTVSIIKENTKRFVLGYLKGLNNFAPFIANMCHKSDFFFIRQSKYLVHFHLLVLLTFSFGSYEMNPKCFNKGQLIKYFYENRHINASKQTCHVIKKTSEVPRI